MFDQTILDEIRTRETARIDKVTGLSDDLAAADHDGVGAQDCGIRMAASDVAGFAQGEFYDEAAWIFFASFFADMAGDDAKSHPESA